jgi:aspartate/methionine/tyrosine aminotransferase
MKLAERMDLLGTETAFQVLAKAKALEAQGRDIVHLEIGEPDFDTPLNIREAAKKAIDEGWTHYGPANGQPDLREAIVEEMKNTRGIDCDPMGVVVTPGAKPIMFFVILALVDPGDEVVYPNPGFPIYESMINFVRGKAVPAPLLMDKEFSFDINYVKSIVSDKTKLFIMNSPQNPTGGKITSEDIAEVAELAKKHDFMVLTDEVYSRMQYDTKFESIASLPGMLDRSIILEGFSKTYAMTGWRAGYGVMNNDLAAQVSKLQVNSNSCTAAFTQRACIEALRGPQDDSEKMVAEFRRRRDIIVDGLNDIPGFKCIKPGGAFYAFPNIEGTGKGSAELETILLNEAGVATLSGLSFGKYGDGFLRFSYANSVENIEKALARVKETVSKF